MSAIDTGTWPDQERILITHDEETGLRAIIAIDSTALGPALGGVRARDYPSMADAMADAQALARAMTMKAAAAGLDLGGGKTVVQREAGVDDEAWGARLDRLALAIDSLGGAYIAAEDVGTTIPDMDRIGERTRFVVGRSLEAGGGGDLSHATAVVVLGAIREAVRVRLGRSSLEGVRVGVIGVGKVGAHLAAMLAAEGAAVSGADVDRAALDALVAAHGVAAASTDDLLRAPLDVLAPCATGGMIDAAVADGIRAAVIAGAANNPLSDPAIAARLAEREILYVPDFLANCGGIIHGASEYTGFDQDKVDRDLAAAVERIGDVLDEAAVTGALPADIALRRARARLDGARAAG